VLRLRAVVGGRDGTPPVIEAAAEGPRNNPQAVIEVVLNGLRSQGVEMLLGERSV
jgi:hypothetical protein